MEQGTILYFYLQRKYQGRCCAKRHWWQTAKLHALAPFELGEQDRVKVVACPVPAFFYKRKPWKPQVLKELMENMLYEAEGMSDAILSPPLEKLFPEEQQRRWRPRLDTVRLLMGFLIEEKVEGGAWGRETAQIRLGAPQDSDWQMQFARELLTPYLTQINRCTVWYEPIPGVNIRDELETFLEDYYYEYGLVVQTRPYGEADTAAEGINIDLRGDNLYRQTWKYLDTMVKNKYDKLVN